MPTALTTLYGSATDVVAILSQNGVDFALDDDSDGVTGPTENNYLLLQGMNWSADQINTYLLNRYLATDLANSWMVNSWFATLAALFVSQRRMNPVPLTLWKAAYGGEGSPGVMGMMLQVYNYALDLPGIPEQVMI